jgi:hypothetical protein
LQLLNNFIRIVSVIAGFSFVLLAPIAVLFFSLALPTASFVLIVGILLLIVSRLEYLSEVSLGPLKAKMQDKIVEASITIKELKIIAEILSETTLVNLMGSNFIKGITLKKKIETCDKLVKALAKIGFSSKEMEEVLFTWNKGITVIYYRQTLRVLERRQGKYTINLDEPERKKVSDEIATLLDLDNLDPPKPHVIRKIIQSKNLDIDSELEKILTEYQLFLDTGEILNKEAFYTY